MSTIATHSTPETPVFADPIDRILVVGGGPQTLDLLRLATIRSDDVVLIASALDEATHRYARRFAVEWISREATVDDIAAATSVLVTLENIDDANRLVRAARRAHIPIHVGGRPLVSDFSLLEFLEGRSAPAGSL